jgi:hypothetical protein
MKLLCVGGTRKHVRGSLLFDVNLGPLQERRPMIAAAIATANLWRHRLGELTN